jgi:hypothetical protein
MALGPDQALESEVLDPGAEVPARDPASVLAEAFLAWVVEGEHGVAAAGRASDDLMESGPLLDQDL